MGEIITFYSYKGGTGRTMAMANIAVFLSRHASKSRILVIDWDLEAPGLHRYFASRLSIKDEELDNRLGLIDLLRDYNAYVKEKNLSSDFVSDEDSDALFQNFDLDNYCIRTKISDLDLMKAGRFDADYTAKVNGFDWYNFFERANWLFSRFANYLSSRYDYVLIDSRTGLTDTSNICTALMPEKLVVVFTPNTQSLTGVANLVEQATWFRRQSSDFRPLIVYPLASRIELTATQLRQDWRLGNSEKGIIGYQVIFEALFKQVYDLPDCDLTPYFDDVQIQHDAFYAYGEEIAVLVERSSERLSIARAYENFYETLENTTMPWEYESSSGSSSPIARRSTIDTSAGKSVWASLSGNFSRRDMEARFDIFQHFALEQQRNFYSFSVENYRRAASQTNLIRATLALLTGMVFAGLGIIYAMNLVTVGACQSTSDITITTCQAWQLASYMLLIAAIILPVLALFFNTLSDLYQWDRLINLYDATMENIEVADARSPHPEMDDLNYLASLTAYIQGTLEVISDESKQWGTSIRTPKGIQEYLREAEEKAARSSNTITQQTYQDKYRD